MILNIILISVMASIVVVDQISKALVVNLMDLGQEIEIINGFFRLKYITNPGMSFSLFDGDGQRWVFMVISPIALIAIAVYLFAFSKDKLLTKLGLSFIFAGGFSNMIDRIFYGENLFHGEVIDMFDFYGIWDAIFNVADSFVCIGAALTITTLLYDIIVTEGTKKKKAEESVTQGGSMNENASIEPPQIEGDKEMGEKSEGEEEK